MEVRGKGARPGGGRGRLLARRRQPESDDPGDGEAPRTRRRPTSSRQDRGPRIQVAVMTVEPESPAPRLPVDPRSSCGGSTSGSAPSTRTGPFPCRSPPAPIHGLIGENGAGKSTLMNIVYGFHRPTPARSRSGRWSRSAARSDAIEAGIGMVHQHFMLVDNFTVLENVVLGAEGWKPAGAGPGPRPAPGWRSSAATTAWRSRSTSRGRAPAGRPAAAGGDPEGPPPPARRS
jgi:hypothetical protein